MGYTLKNSFCNGNDRHRWLAAVLLGLICSVFQLNPAAAQSDITIVTSSPDLQAPTDPTVFTPTSEVRVASPEIIGGGYVPVGAMPWQAALVTTNAPDDRQGQFCGGTLIASSWILTAAHCMYDSSGYPRYPAHIQVVLGKVQLSASGGEHLRVAEIIIHQNYDRNQHINDIALLRLAQPSTQTPIALLNLTLPSGVKALVTGWGMTTPTVSASTSDLLKGAWTPLVALQTCAAANASIGPITVNHLCAGNPTTLEGSCHGDSGGPLMVRTADQRWAQIGIVSWGQPGCNAPQIYNVYTNVMNYFDWMIGEIQASINMINRYEPNDSWQSAHTLLPNGARQRHSFQTSSDVDWAAFPATAGSSYIVETFRLASGVDTVLWIFAPGIGWLQNDNIAGLRSAIGFTAQQSGTHYIAVVPKAGSTTGQGASYDLRATFMMPSRASGSHHLTIMQNGATDFLIPWTTSPVTAPYDQTMTGENFDPEALFVQLQSGATSGMNGDMYRLFLPTVAKE